MKIIENRWFMTKPKKMKEADLNAEAAKAGTYYLSRMAAKHFSTKEKADMVNNVAHGFSMGWRECEKAYGAKE